VLEESLHGVAQACVLTTSYPRTMIQIVVQIVYDDGSVLAAAVNAMTLALMDSGVAMRTTITAASVAYMPGSADPWLDPTAAETEVRGRLTAIRTYSRKSAFQLTIAWLTCRISLDQAAESVHTAAVATTSPDDVVMMDSLGAFTAQQLLDARQAAAHASAAVVEFLRTALERTHKRGTAKRA